MADGKGGSLYFPERHRRRCDLVVWGATGFTGSLVAEYLARRVGADLRWALAGRNRAKLEDVKSKLAEINPGLADSVDVLVGDSADQASVDAIVCQTKVVIACAGPFLKYGQPVADACVRFGTDYVDITGEPPYIQGLIDKYHERAAERGTILLPASGFDSVPSDAAALLVVDFAQRQLGTQPRRVLTVVETRAGASGGTMRSVLDLAALPLKKVAEFAHPFYFNPGNRRLPADPAPRVRPEDRDMKLPAYNKELKTWTAPWVMAGVNNKVVRRSAYLAEERRRGYGPNFSYNEAYKVPNLLFAWAYVLAVLAFMALAWLPLTRSLLRRLVPQPGQGPSPQRRQKSSFRYTVLAETEDGRKVRGVFAGGDPGYTETAKMAAEAGLFLVERREQALIPGGVLTTAAAFGTPFLDRLRAAGLEISVDVVHGDK